jgi:phage regulator Rha-like protein
MAKSSRAIILADEVIMNKIYFIRGQKVMIDRDLAELYGIETRRLKEQVNRNINRFPDHFMFELSKEENENLRSQNATLKQGAFSKYLPYAFTEHGVLMLSNVLKTESAIEMSIKIIDVFVKLREIIMSHKDILLKLEQLEKKLLSQEEDVLLIFKYVKQLLARPNPPRPRIGFRRKDEKV